MERKEIGGYLELERFSGVEYHDGLHRLNLGRTALLYLLNLLECKKLMVPYYLCDSLIEKCRQAGIQLSFYHIDEELTPHLSRELVEDEYLLLVNYYGQLTDEKIIVCQKRFERIIVDHTHSFFQRPLIGVPTFYSCRKFFGLPDGAYVYSGESDKAEPQLTKDISNSRMSHVLGRYEESAGNYFKAMHESAASFYHEPIKVMSDLTRNLLTGIDYKIAQKRRNENACFLDQHLKSLNGLDWELADSPLAYPFYVEDGQVVRRKLAEQQIYVPTYWNNVIAQMGKETVEYRYAKNILPLPIDQRYNIQEMKIIVKTLGEILTI